MGLFGFGGVTCTHCGNKAKMSSRLLLNDGEYVCGDCMMKVPYYMADVVKNEYNSDDFNALCEHIKYSYNELRPVFKETHRYGTVVLDAEHGLFCLGTCVNYLTMFMKCSKVESFDLEFDAEEIKKKVFSTQVEGRVLMSIEVDSPKFTYDEIMIPSVIVPADKRHFGTQVTYSNPKDMVDFYEVFGNTCIAFREAEFEEMYGDADEDADETPADFRKAMALFMFDELDEITVEKLKAQRNRLIKAFHPDKGTAEDNDYAQKINNAYDILYNHLKAKE